MAALALAMLLSSLGTSVANVGLPSLAQAFGAPFHQVQWIVLAYLLTVTTLIVSVGRVGDLVGRRRLLLVGLSVFTVASAACGLAPTLGMLIAFRAAQGVGAAVMMALALALVGETVPKERTGAAMGLLGTMSAAGTALGPSLGGALITLFGWRAMFLVKVPLGLLALLLAHRSLPRDRNADSRPGGLDPVGTVLLAGALAAYALALTVGGGRIGALNLALLSAAAIGSVLFVVAESRAKAPLIRLATLREAGLGAGLAMSAIVSTVVMTTLIVGPFYLTGALGLAPAATGLALSSGPAVVALIGAPAGRLVDQIGARRVTRAGLIGMTAGSGGLALLPSSLGVAGYVGLIMVMTAGYALFQTANNTAVMSGSRPEQRGVVSGVLNLSRNLGLVTGASLMGTVFALASGASDVATASPAAVATGMRVTYGIAAMLIVSALAVAIAPVGRGRQAHPRGRRAPPVGTPAVQSTTKKIVAGP